MIVLWVALDLPPEVPRRGAAEEGLEMVEPLLVSPLLIPDRDVEPPVAEGGKLRGEGAEHHLPAPGDRGTDRDVALEEVGAGGEGVEDEEPAEGVPDDGPVPGHRVPLRDQRDHLG